MPTEGSYLAKEVALVGTLSTVAGVFRVPFAFIPSVQPTTFIVMITGYVFGMRIGFLTGMIAAFVSNIFLGQGPWTPFQMLCWGLSGLTAGMLGRHKKSFKKWQFTLLCTSWGFIFGWIMNLYYWFGFVYPLNFKTFLVTYAASFVMDSMHAVGNCIFALLFGAAFYKILIRFKHKLWVELV